MSSAPNHNGGAIHFGPDGKLYAGVGENANGANAQSLSNRLGKILRIVSNRTIPSDNPNRSRESPARLPARTARFGRPVCAIHSRSRFNREPLAYLSMTLVKACGRKLITVLPDRTTAGRSQKVLLPRRIQISGTRSSSMRTGRAAPLAAPSSAELLQSVGAAISEQIRWQIFLRRLVQRLDSWLDPSNNTASNFASEISSPVDLQVGPDGALYYLTRGGVFRIQATPSQAMNISTRARVETGDNVLIGGFIVTGSAAKKVIVRAIGPSLSQHGVGDVLADPTLELHHGNGTLLRSNDNWRDDPIQASQISASGLAPSNNLESAIIATLQPGNYTAIVRGKNSRHGVALAEGGPCRSGSGFTVGKHQRLLKCPNGRRCDDRRIHHRQ